LSSFPSLSHFSPLQEKESISGQNLIDNLLNFGLINPLPKNLIVQLAD
jgi:hypothetical protein